MHVENECCKAASTLWRATSTKTTTHRPSDNISPEQCCKWECSYNIAPLPASIYFCIMLGSHPHPGRGRGHRTLSRVGETWCRALSKWFNAIIVHTMSHVRRWAVAGGNAMAMAWAMASNMAGKIKRRWQWWCWWIPRGRVWTPRGSSSTKLSLRWFVVVKLIKNINSNDNAFI